METKRLIKGLTASLGAAALSFIASAANAAQEAAIKDPTEGWNELWRELMIDITVIGVIFAVATLYLLIANRRRRPGEEGRGKRLSPLAAFGWVAIPVFAFMADDIYLGAKNFELWNIYRTVPQNALTIEVEGAMWSWDFRYPDGTTTNNELRVPAGKPVHLKMTSRDVVHSLFIPDYHVKWDVIPGKVTYLWFYPKEAGEHVVTCTEFCGMMHSAMFGKVIVMPEDEYSRWKDSTKQKGGSV